MAFLGPLRSRRSAGDDFMAQYAGLIWVILLGPPETNRRKPFCFNGRLPVAQLICFEALLCKLRCLNAHIFCRSLFVWTLTPMLEGLDRHQSWLVAFAGTHRFFEAFVVST